MKEIVASGKFKKDLKRYRVKPETLRKLYIENDTLLIWLDKAANIIKLVRFGTHSELFK